MNARRTLITGLVVLTAAVSSAKTIGWWKFDDEAPGTLSTAETRAANAASADYGSGVFRSITGTGAGTVGTVADHMPVFVESRHTKVYDPVTDQQYDNTAAVGYQVTGTTDVTVEGGAVCIPDSENLRPANFTIECFVCTTQKVLYTMVPIVGRPCSSFTDETFGLCMLNNGCLFARMRSNGSSHLSDLSGEGKKQKINDGRWHHVAMTYDATAGRMTVYVDYVEDFHRDWSGPLEYRDDKSIYIGGYQVQGRKLDGRIDEVRFSDTALEPKDFLRFDEPTPAVVDKDTLIFASFEGGKEPLEERNFNEIVRNGPKMELKAVGGEKPPAALTDSVPCPILERGTNLAAQVVNASSIHLPTNGLGNGYALCAEARTYCATNLTIECFIRNDEPIRGTGTTENQKIFQIGSKPTLLLVREFAGSFYIAFENQVDGKWTSQSVPGATTDLSCGVWHHVAVVYDAEAKTITFTIDYNKSYTKSNVVLYSGEAQNLYFGSDNTGTKQLYCGSFDGIRVTARALTRAEFLNRGGTEEPSSTLATIPFDGDYTVGPFPHIACLSEGAGYAFAADDGNVPTFTDEVVGPLISRDGTNQTIVATNTAALRVDKGYAAFGGATEALRRDFTAECFCRIRWGTKFSGIMRLNRGSSATGDPAWALYLNEGTDSEKDDYSKLQFRMICRRSDGSSSNVYATCTLPVPLKGDKWHHLAVTGESDGGTNVLVSLYCDYKKVTQVNSQYTTVENGTIRLPGLFSAESGKSPCFTVGASGQATAGMKADFDEVRISDHALDPSEFLRVYKEKKGLLLIVR